jgi:hypothetical protein
MFRLRHLPLLALSASALFACAGADRTPSDSAAAASASAATAATADSGALQDGDENIAWTSNITAGAITEITEQVTFGTDGTAQRVLRFSKDGALTEYSETRTQVAQQSDKSPTPMTVTMRLTFAGDSVSTSSKTVDGAETPIRPYEVDNIRRHASSILERLRTPAAPRN